VVFNDDDNPWRGVCVCVLSVSCRLLVVYLLPFVFFPFLLPPLSKLSLTKRTDDCCTCHHEHGPPRHEIGRANKVTLLPHPSVS